MINLEVLKIALAGLLHDIGKFSERAEREIPANYIASNQSLYQPEYKGRYTHQHSLHTAYFLDENYKYFPEELTRHSSDAVSLINLASKHHKPDSPEQLIISEADHLSSGIERKEFEETDTYTRSAREIPLMTILEDISITNKWKENKPENFNFVYPVQMLSPNSIFPIKKDEYGIPKYKELYEKFITLFRNLPHKSCPKLWFEHLDSLLLLCCSSIPSATVGITEKGFKEIVSDISLYDHGRLTAAFATALYIYHSQTNSMDKNSIKDRESEKFIIIEGNLYGIQDFIFSEGGSTVKNAAKLLRGRSFYVSLLSELAADYILEQIGLPITSIVTNAAGKFKIIAPNTEETTNAIKMAKEKINQWLIEKFYGEVSIGIVYIKASYNDFIQQNGVSEVLKKIGKASEIQKFDKINILKNGGSVTNYLNDFSSEFGVCPVCNRRAARGRNKIKEDNLCDICYDHVKIGKELVHENRIAITTKDANLKEKLRVPVFDKYQLAFVTGELSELAKEGKVIHFWDINKLWQSDKYSEEKIYSFKLINGYVPRFREEMDTDEIIEKLTYGEKKEDKIQILETLREDTILSFHHIAKFALEKSDDGYVGVDALGVFKADIDNLGTIFLKGLRPEKRTFSRYTTLSRQLNLFFTLHIPYLCRTKFKQIYTIFAGGDDLFLLGPWTDMISFAKRLSEDFNRYTCENSEITLSAGVYITKPDTPVLTMAEQSEKALEYAKASGKNRITIFNVPVRWNDLEYIENIRNQLNRWLEEQLITRSLIYKLNEILEMVRQERIIRQQQISDPRKLNALTWRSKLYYHVIRNVGKGKTKEDRINIATEILENLVKWLEMPEEAFRIPLWQTIYMKRRA